MKKIDVCEDRLCDYVYIIILHVYIIILHVRKPEAQKARIHA